MKKIFVLFMVSVLFLSACGKVNSNRDTLKELSLADKEILSKISNTRKLDIITERYTEEQIFEKSFYIGFIIL